MKKKLILLFTILALILVSCTNTIEAPDCSWDEIFLQYWNAMNTEYVHFSDDRTYDWDAVYDEYLPKFKALDYKNANDSITAFKYFKEIAVRVHDNHYNLTVRDGLGNTLSTSPALLNKYKANGGDIMDYPDITIPNDIWGDKKVSVNNPDKSVDTEELRTIYKTAIGSFFEVQNLIAGKDITVADKSDSNEVQSTEEDEEPATTSEYGYFHNSDGNNVNEEFHDNAYYGYTFKAFTSDDTKDLGGEIYYAMEWNAIFEALSLETFFYGVNKDNEYYLYFSSFGNPLFLEDDILTKKTLTPEEEDKIKGTTTEKLRNYVRDLIVDYNTPYKPAADGKASEGIPDGKFKKAIGDRIKALYRLQDMYATLKSAVTYGRCTFGDKDEMTGDDKVTKDNITGVIIDLRGNGGGYVSFLSTIWGVFFQNPTQFGYIRYKAGYSRLEYTPWIGFSITDGYVNKDLKENMYSGRVAVLVNGFSVSCSEISCVIAKLLPNSRIIGHTTFGGTCALSDRTIFNSGPFTSEHLSIYTTTYQFVDMSHESFEIVGIKPDETTSLNPTKDCAYIAAVEWVKK